MEYKRTRPGRQTERWDAERLRTLRRHLGLTQQQLADELGMRQQTISEWETGAYQPRGASTRLLGMIAERAGFGYETGSTVVGRGSSEHDGSEPANG
jgi:DNA-binding transcriptional regulator YiaG